MYLSGKTGVFLLLVLMTSVLLIGCGDDVKTPRQSTTEGQNSANDNSTADDSEGSTVTLDADTSNTSDTTEKKSGGNGQTVVKFEKGASSRSYKNSISKGSTQTYVVNVSTGQEMTVKITSNKDQAYFRIKSPSGKYSDADDGTGFLELLDEPLKESGNYKITVYAKSDNVNYSISISVTGGSTSASTGGGKSDGDFTKTVKFGAGKSSASYSADFNATGPDSQTYILGASSGQKMTVSVNSDVAFTIVSPGGKTLANQTTSYSGTLPDDGNYRITIDPNKARFASYKINFAVK